MLLEQKIVLVKNNRMLVILHLDRFGPIKVLSKKLKERIKKIKVI